MTIWLPLLAMAVTQGPSLEVTCDLPKVLVRGRVYRAEITVTNRTERVVRFVDHVFCVGVEAIDFMGRPLNTMDWTKDLRFGMPTRRNVVAVPPGGSVRVSEPFGPPVTSWGQPGMYFARAEIRPPAERMMGLLGLTAQERGELITWTQSPRFQEIEMVAPKRPGAPRLLNAQEVVRGLEALIPLVQSSSGLTRLDEEKRAKLEAELGRLTRRSGASLKQVAEAFQKLGLDGDGRCFYLYGLYLTRQVKPESAEAFRKAVDLDFEPMRGAKGEALTWPWAYVKGRPTLVVHEIEWPFGRISYAVSGWWVLLEAAGIQQQVLRGT